MNIKYLLSCVFLIGAITAASAQEKRILTLDECKERALKYNADIQTGKIDIEAARQTRKEAFTKYFPKISAGAATYKADDNLVKVDIPDLTQLGLPVPAMEAGMLEEGNLVTVSAMQPVFAGGQIVNANKLAKTAMEASVLQLDVATDKVELETENYYWKIVSLKEAEKTVNVLDTLLQSLHKDVSLAVKAGVTTQNDLLTVQLKQNELQSTRLQVENGIRLSCMALSQYIGLPLDSADHIDVPEFALEIKSPGNYLADHQTALSLLSTSKLLEKNVEDKGKQMIITIDSNELENKNNKKKEMNFEREE